MRRLSSFVRNWPMAVFFTVSLISTALIFLSRGALLATYFHPAPTDSAMDFFNTLASAASDYPYATGSNYPPLCHLLLKTLHYLVPAGVPSEENLLTLGVASQGLFLRNYENAFIVYIITHALCVAIIALSVCHICARMSEVRRTACVLMVIFAGPMLFLLERGNILIFAITATFVFFALHNSESLPLRGVAYLSIAVAAGLKIYPFIFAFILLREHRTRGFFIILGLTVFLYALPFALLGGLDAVFGFFRGLTAFTAEHSSHGTGLQFSIVNLFSIVELLTGLVAPGWLVLFTTLMTLILGVFLILFSRKRWHGELCAGLMCVLIPSVSYTYSLVFLLPAFIDAFGCNDLGPTERKRSPLDRAETILLLVLTLSLCVIVLPIVQTDGNSVGEVAYPLYWSGLLINLSLIVQLISLGVLGFRHRLNRPVPLQTGAAD